MIKPIISWPLVSAIFFIGFFGSQAYLVIVDNSRVSTGIGTALDCLDLSESHFITPGFVYTQFGTGGCQEFPGKS